MADVEIDQDTKEDKDVGIDGDESGAPGGPDDKSNEVIGKRVRVKKWNAVAFWSYDIENDTCAICHNQLMVPCYTTDMQLLTNHGFMFLYDIKKSFVNDGNINPNLLFASYNPSQSCIEYYPSTGKLIEKETNSLIEFTDAVEAKSWAAESDKYGKSGLVSSDEIIRESNHVSVLVTPDHNMYARKGAIDADGRGRWHDDPFSLVPASNLLIPKVCTSGGPGRKRGDSIPMDKHCIQFLGNADNGFKSDAQLEFVQVLKLDSSEKLNAFLQFYGYWLGDGSMDCVGKYVSARPRKPADQAFIQDKFNKLGLAQGVDYSLIKVSPGSGGWFWKITNKSWYNYFAAEYGHKYVDGSKVQYVRDDGGDEAEQTSSVKSYWYWVWKLDKELARLVIEGLHQADGTMAKNIIYTSSVKFRDDTIRLALHAGYSAFFSVQYPAGTIRGYYIQGVNDGKVYNQQQMEKMKEKDNSLVFNPVHATADSWKICYTDYNMAKQTIVASEMRSVTYSGPVWCVTVPPHNTVIVRRAFNDENGIVTKASRPIVCGQCITCEAEPHHAEECSVAWGQCGHSYHFHCLGEGTQVSDASGVSFPIEKFPSNRSILGFDLTKNGIVPAKMINNNDNRAQGQKECIKLVLEDGRSIVCTKDHEILTEDKTFKPAGSLVEDQSFVICGIESPVTDFTFSTQWRLELSETIVFDTADANSMFKALIFARIIGYLLTDGCIPKLRKDGGVHSARLYLGHSSDLQQVVQDFKAAFNDNLSTYIDSKGLYIAYLPLWFTRLLISFDPCFAPGARIGRDFLLPKFLFESNVPLVVIREFLAGLCGGDGLSPGYAKTQDYIHCGGFIQSKSLAKGESLVEGMNKIVNLLNKFNVEASLCGGLRKSSENSKIVTQLLSIHNVVKFTENIGIRYCSYKALRYSGATAFFRYREQITEQRNRIIVNTIELAQARLPGMPLKLDCDLLKQHMMRSHQDQCPPIIIEAIKIAKDREEYLYDKAAVDVKTIEDYQTRGQMEGVRDMDILDWCKRTNIHALFVDQQVELDHISSISQQVEEEAEAEDQDLTTSRKPFCCHKRSESAMPYFKLKVIQKKNVGIKRVYDLEVENPINSFLANGIVVHNCITRWLRTRSTCPLDDEEWDFVQY